MRRSFAPGIGTLVAFGALAYFGSPLWSPPPFGLKSRVPWTAGKLSGTPEPPPPFRSLRVFPHLTFQNPLDLAYAPGGARLFVMEQYGKVFSLEPGREPARPNLFIDLKKEVLGLEKVADCKGVGQCYGFTFHPDFARNRYCYICYVLEHRKENHSLEKGSRVSRFTVTAADPPRCDPASEVILLEWREGGHNGGCLKFGPDGYLYVSTGDGASPNPPDALDTGQDLSDLLSSILRIDVDRREEGKPYSVPKDNPFVRTPGARPEIWCYGLRNPWRMSFDRSTGALWVGDVGWERWELVYRVEKGANYGWSLVEGPQPVHPNGRRGPTPVVPPTIALPHPEAASVTGGYVYRGTRFGELAGEYVFGDWETRTVWAAPAEGPRLGERRALAQTEQRIVAWTEDASGELLLLDYQGGLYRLERNVPGRRNERFPDRLSQTGIFRSVKDETPESGVVPFSINAAAWADHAVARRYVAIPGAGVPRNEDGQAVYPADTVFAKTIEIDLGVGKRRRLETQVLHSDGRAWRGYTYRWNPEQDDAILVGPAGDEEELEVRDPRAPSGRRIQIWRYPSRSECVTCHNPWNHFTLAYTEPQLDRWQVYGTEGDNQVRSLRNVGLFPEPADPRTLRPARLVGPGESGERLDLRARSYLHVNCAHCHQFGGGGSTMLELRYTAKIEDMHLINEPPTQGTFDVGNARVVAPGDPGGSVLFYRLAKSGRGHMPHLGSRLVDVEGLGLLESWISGMPQRAAAPALEAHGAAARSSLEAELSTPRGALGLLRAIDSGTLEGVRRDQVVARAAAHPSELIRDLFERWIPPEKRARRLGDRIDLEALLSVEGDSERGEAYFFGPSSCKSCHRVGLQGGTLGPELSRIGGKLSRALILEKLLDPSKTVEPAYATYRVETQDGQVYSGLLAKRTPEEIVLKDAPGHEITLGAASLKRMVTSQKSMMPDGLLRDLTAQEAADLLKFLEALR